MQKNANNINKHCLVAGLQGGVGGPADLPAPSGSATCSNHWKSQVHITWVGFHCEYCELRGVGKIADYNIGSGRARVMVVDFFFFFFT